MSAIDDLIQALEALKQKSDGTILYAAEVHDLVDGIFAAMEMAGDVTVATTPIEGGNRITITDPEGVAHEFDVMDGTPGTDGKDAVNPFKGMFADVNSIPAEVTAAAVEGDYVFVGVPSSKKLSILGDSISTFSGYIPTGNAAWYPSQNEPSVATVADTWWWKVMLALNMTLDTNNSWSGSRVTTTDGDAASAVYSRCTALGSPDVIIFFMGLNDFNHDVVLGSYDGNAAVPSGTTEFADAYAATLDKMLTAYPSAKVYCCTLPLADERSGTTGFPEINGNGVTIPQYNVKIKQLAAAFGVEVIDLACCGLTYQNMSVYNPNLLHPNAAGHTIIANYIVRQLAGAMQSGVNMYRYNGTAWVDTSKSIDPGALAEFGSGEKVAEVRIASNLATAGVSDLARALDVAQIKSGLGDIPAGDTMVTVDVVNNVLQGFIRVTGGASVNPNGGIQYGTNASNRYAIIPIPNGAKSIRFSGVLSGGDAEPAAGYAFYNCNSADDLKVAQSSGGKLNVSGNVVGSLGVYPHDGSGVDKLTNIVAEVPVGAKFLCTMYSYTTALVGSNFYCYANGVTVMDMLAQKKVLTMTNGTSLNGYYIDVSTGKWTYTSNHTDTAFYYEVKKGERIRIVPNATENAAIAFIKSIDEPAEGGDPAIVAFYRPDEEACFIASEDCYLYVFNYGVSTSHIRWPELILSSGSGSNIATTEDIDAVKKTLSEISKDDGVESTTYINNIDGGTDNWTSADTAKAHYFSLKAGDSVTVKSNANYGARIAFVKPNQSMVINSEVQYITAYPDTIRMDENAEQTFTVDEECLFYVFEISTNLNLNRYPQAMYLNNRPSLTLDKPDIDTGGIAFMGEMPDFRKNTFSRKVIATLPNWGSYKNSGAGLHQGMAVYDKYICLFTFSEDTPAVTKIGLFDLETASLLATIELPYSTYNRPHGNALSFSNTYHSANSVLPLLYVSQWDADSERGCLVYDITKTNDVYSAELVQAIMPSATLKANGDIFGLGATDWCVDAEMGYLYSVAYKLGGDDAPSTDNDETNPTMICKFALPTVGSTVEVELSGSDVLEHFSVESTPIRQSAVVANGKLIMIAGALTSQYTNVNWIVCKFVDLCTRQVVTKLPLGSYSSITGNKEPEGVAVYNDNLVIGWRSNSNIYQIDFRG